MYQIMSIVGVIIGTAGLILAILAYRPLRDWLLKNKKVVVIAICSFTIGILLGAIFMGANNYPTYEEIVEEANFVFGRSSNCSDSDCALMFYDRGLEKGWEVYYCTFDCEHVGVHTFNAVRDNKKNLFG